MVAATLQLIWQVGWALTVPSTPWMGSKLNQVLGDLLTLMIALEVLQNITSYLRRHVVQIELVLLTAMGQGAVPSRRRLLRNWLIFAPFAFPFVLITHDWFRYGVVLLLLALLLTAAEAAADDAPFTLRVAWPFARAEVWSLLPISAMVLIGPASSDVRKCLPHNYFHASLGMLGLAAAVYWLSLRFPGRPVGSEVSLAEQGDHAD